MKVLIVGSYNFSESIHSEEEFAEACRNLGEVLARNKHEIIVSSSKPHTADYYVVEGARRVKGRHKLTIFRLQGFQQPFKDSCDELKKNFDISFRKANGDWAAARVPQVVTCDAIILIGGQEKTAHVAHIAPALNRPVLAIPCFGGIAREIWEQLEPYYRKIGIINDHGDHLIMDWNKDSADYSIKLLKKIKDSGLFADSDKTTHFLLASSALTGFTLWAWIFAAPFNSLIISLFSLLAISSFLGATLRSLLSILSDPNNILRGSKLIVEVSAGVVLSLGLSMLYLTGGFAVTGNFKFITMLTQQADYIRVSLVLSLLGLTGGLLIERTSEYLETQLARTLSTKNKSS